MNPSAADQPEIDHPGADHPGVTPPDTARLGVLRRYREDLAANNGERFRPGLIAIHVARFGRWRMGIRPKPLRVPFSLLYRVLYNFVHFFASIHLPYSVTIGRRFTLEHSGGITIHGAVVIGDDCIVRQCCTLGIRRMERLHDAPVLGNGVIVGAGAKVLGRVHLGDGCQIGANAVVLDDVPAGAIAAGVPARVVGRVREGGGAEQREMK